MQSQRTLFVCALLACALCAPVTAQPAPAPTIDGVWEGFVTHPDGKPRRFRFTFATDGSRVSGSVAFGDRAVPFKDAWCRKQLLTFQLLSHGRDEALLFSGLVRDADIAFAVYRARGGELSDPVRFTATRPPAP